MKRTPEKASFTASRFAALVGADRHELTRNLETLKASPVASNGRGAEYSLRDLVTAHNGGDERAERIRKNRAESERIELQNSRTRGELVEVQAVKKLGERVMIAIRSRILQFPITDDEKDLLLTELHSLGKMDWSREA